VSWSDLAPSVNAEWFSFLTIIIDENYLVRTLCSPGMMLKAPYTLSNPLTIILQGRSEYLHPTDEKTEALEVFC
jgi:hypothetical protein